jgi:hypothetical protein
VCGPCWLGGMAKGFGEFRNTLPALGSAVPIIIISRAVLSIVFDRRGTPGLGYRTRRPAVRSLSCTG